MIVDSVITGVLDENCYIISKDNECLVVDPGSDYPLIKEKIGDKKVLGILITHSHFDHVGALRNFLTKRSIKIYKKSMVDENEEIEIGPFKFKCFYTPGHAVDQIAFYFEENNSLFSGDFIFKESIGRCDLPGGNLKDMKESIKVLKEFNNETVIYPGHGESTTIGYELENNNYIKELI